MELGTVRAKMRVINTSNRYNGAHKVELMPVYQDSPGDGEENKSFWEATPSGKIELDYEGVDLPWPAGALIFVDFIPIEGKLDEEDLQVTGSWYVIALKFTRSDGGSINLCFSRPSKKEEGGSYWANIPAKDGMIRGSIEMDIDNRPALDAFGQPGSLWHVKFSLAPDSEVR